MNRTRVYIAGPHTRGDVGANSHTAIEFDFWHILHPHPWNFWMVIDKSWLMQAEVVVRLPGDSQGADIEVEWARENGILVFDSPMSFWDHHFSNKREERREKDGDDE